jgi:hypothetical protein
MWLAHVDPARAQAPPQLGCSAVPLSCVQGNGKLLLDFSRHALTWQWTARGVVSITDVENPTLDAHYDLCIYDATPAVVVQTEVPSGGICSGRPCWRAHGWGFEYRDPSGLTGGITKILLRVARRRDRLSVQATGASLALPAAPPTMPLVVQLVRTRDYDGTQIACWTSTTTALTR